jgi:hypothetical protein
MDREQLAKKLYSERVHELMGDQVIDEVMLERLWENKATPQEAVKALQSHDTQFECSPWLSRYLNRK